jgi:hypothetical protein
MQAPPVRVQYEVWIGGLFNVFQRRLVLHPMTAEQTMQSQYTFPGNFQNGFLMHTEHNVGWPFRIDYVSETGRIQLYILRNTKYVMHDAGVERGPIINDLETATVIKPGTRIEYPWGRTVTFQWDDVTSPFHGVDDVTVMIKRPEGFASVRTDHPVHRDKHGLGVLLFELQAINAVHDNAPMKLEGLQEVKEATRSAYNKYGWMSAGFVADKCKVIVTVCGARLPPDLKIKVEKLENALRQAEKATHLYSGGDHVKHIQNEGEQRIRVLTVVSVYQSMYDEMLTVVRDLIGTQGRKDDALAKVLAAFVDAMSRYRQRHKAEFAVQYNEPGA